MKKSSIAVAITALATGALFAATPAQAAGTVHLSKIYYNSPGSDTRSTKSLDAEYVVITNGTSKAVSLKGWTLTDASAHKYTFGTFTLSKGKSVTVHTGKGKNTTTNVYQQRSAYVWNNDKDKATLRKSNGATDDTCSYNSTKHVSVAC